MAKKHNWSEKEYALAIYMALYSDDYKIGIYNHHQCAMVMDISSNAFKMMVDNFKAYNGKTNLGTQCVRMRREFEKCEKIPKEEFYKIASEYYIERWKKTKRKLDVNKYINSIGKKAFVEYYNVFLAAYANPNDIDKYVDKLPDKWSVAGRKMRITIANGLFESLKYKDALKIIAKSKRVSPEIADKALKLLK